MIKIQISDIIFTEFPSFCRGLVIATGMDNRGDAPELYELLRQAVKDAGTTPISLNDDPRITVWNEAHRRFNSNPNRFPPAHLALRRRVQKPEADLPFISRAVTAMNLASVKYVIPVGGDDLCQAGRWLELRRADGSEEFAPLGHPEEGERPEPGEVIYVNPETGQVMCRRWNWRNCHPTRITEETTSLVMNIDALGVGSEALAVSTRDQVASLLEEFCQAHVQTALLSRSCPTYQLDL